MRKGLLFGLAALAASASLPLAGPAVAAEEGPALPKLEWSFDGPFGTYDRQSLQRGLQVYREVCSSCHGLKYVAFRNLADLGYSEDEIKAFAAEYTVTDGPDDDGEMFERPGAASDYFPAPFPNEKAAAAANSGAVPPDLSLMAKARAGGADHIHGILTGYEDLVPDAVLQSIFEHETMKNEEKYEADLAEYNDKLEAYNDKVEAGEQARRPLEPVQPQPIESIEDLGLAEVSNFNAYFPGYGIAMAQPLYEDGVAYADGTPATIDQMAADVSHFLMWAAEPKLEDRKGAGIKVLIFLVVFTGVLYAAKRKVWKDVH
ncbi:MAG: cytochrome c1 [Kiloniellaceae bacterium]|nr:cytochrome c1 [Kiloniellaceae bacterium]